MHMIEAIIKPEKLSDVKAALKNVGVTGLTVMDVRGYGRQLGETESYRGAKVEASFLPKVLIKAVVPASSSDSVVAAITEAARSGSVGDGKIFVFPVASATRIRTGEKDADAL
ncbi:MAG: P-II family nitrogen regulator [Planctomycetota bacterium]